LALDYRRQSCDTSLLLQIVVTPKSEVKVIGEFLVDALGLDILAVAVDML